MAHKLNPITLYQDGLEWTGRSSGSQLFAATVAYAVPVALLAAAPYVGGYTRLIEIVAFLLLAAVFVPFAGHMVRRLNELNWSGWLWWLFVLPWVGILFLLVLLFKEKGQRKARHGTLFLSAGFGLACLFSAYCVTRTMWSPYQITSSAMAPTLIAGDIVAVGRLDRTPDRGEVIAFAHPNGHVSLFRVVGMPGDLVGIQQGKLILNGAVVTQTPTDPFEEVMEHQGPNRILPLCGNGAVGQGATCRTDAALETLPGQKRPHRILNIHVDGNFDNFAPVAVKPGEYFVLGDNRDNALDSRFSAGIGGVGMVSADAVIGRAHRIVWSFTGSEAQSLWNVRLSRLLRAVR